MLKNIKESILLWLGITTFLCYGDMFFEIDNLMWFGRQFLVVAIAGSLMVFMHQHLVDRIREKKPMWFRRIAVRVTLYSFINVLAVHIVILGLFLMDSGSAFSDYIPVFVDSALIVTLITASVHMYSHYRYRMALSRKQQSA